MKDWIRVSLICAAVVLGVLGNPYPSQAQQTQDSSYQAITDKFFDLLQQGKGADAVDYIFSTNPMMKKLPDQVDQVRSGFGSLGTLMGNYVSHTKLIETKVADMFVYQHYFVAYDRQPISIRLKYYKPGTTWLCYGVQFDGNLAEKIQKDADDRIPFEVK